MSERMRRDDPAYFLLEEGMNDPSKRSTPTVYEKGCYICEDPEFAMMGLPLCYACNKCGAHVAADAGSCECGHDQGPLEGE